MTLQVQLREKGSMLMFITIPMILRDFFRTFQWIGFSELLMTFELGSGKRIQRWNTFEKTSITGRRWTWKFLALSLPKVVGAGLKR